MTKSISFILALCVTMATALIATAVVLTFATPNHTAASTLAYAVPKVATTSIIVVGPQATTTLFLTHSNCVDRVISTAAGAIMLSFNPQIKPTGLIGHAQAASTSVAYNNGDYGCSEVDAFGYASSTITITEFLQ